MGKKKYLNKLRRRTEREMCENVSPECEVIRAYIATHKIPRRQAKTLAKVRDPLQTILPYFEAYQREAVQKAIRQCAGALMWETGSVQKEKNK